jgi:hypothetical protein
MGSWRSTDTFYLLFVLLFRFQHACSEPGFVFNKACLLNYNHMSFGGGPLEVGTEQEAEKLASQNDKDSANGNIPRNFWFKIVLPPLSNICRRLDHF